MSVNKVILVGNVGKDPEVRYLDKNVAVANFTLATTERGFTTQTERKFPSVPNGTISLPGEVWLSYPKNTSVKEVSCILKGKFKHARGRKMALSDTRPKFMRTRFSFWERNLKRQRHSVQWLPLRLMPFRRHRMPRMIYHFNFFSIKLNQNHFKPRWFFY